MFSVLTFLLGLALGAMYAPVIKPLLLKLWDKLKRALETPKE